MFDSRGVQRGYCTVCGIDECSEYEKTTGSSFCSYCGCPPTKHIKIITSSLASTENAISNLCSSSDDYGGEKKIEFESQFDDRSCIPQKIRTEPTLPVVIFGSVSYENFKKLTCNSDGIIQPECQTRKNIGEIQNLKKLVRNSQKIFQPELLRMENIEEDVCQNNKNWKLHKTMSYLLPNEEELDLPLPTFSPLIENTLRDGTIRYSLWNHFIDECASFYLNIPNFTNKHSYRVIGKKMFAKYPAIAMEGRKPWTKFLTCLSRKIRRERLMRKISFGSELKKTENVPQKLPSCQLNQTTTVLSNQMVSSTTDEETMQILRSQTKRE